MVVNPGNNGFESVTLTSGNPVSKSWTKPISTVRGAGGQSAADNFLTVAALLDGSHNTYNNVYAAADASMGPKLELAVTDVN